MGEKRYRTNTVTNHRKMTKFVPKMLETLPFWTAIEMAWKMKYLDLFSPVASAILKS